MVNVCDAIMGNGKSQSAITYMNEHKDQRFIYITPYLEEAARIKAGCPDLDFIEPSDKLPMYGFTKSRHTAALLKNGENITTTHQSFKNYTQEMLDDIERYKYTLIVDESVEVLECANTSAQDIQILIDSGYLRMDGDVVRTTGKPYNGGRFGDLLDFTSIRDLISVDGTNSLFYWLLPPRLFTAFKDVFVLTYLFESQSIHHFLEINKIPYRYIGIEKTGRGTGFRFSDNPHCYTPEYVKDLGKMIRILDRKKLNEIGDSRYALSMSWFNNSKHVDRLKKNVTNCFRNVWKNVPADQKMWGVYKSDFQKMRGKGYTKAYLVFNARATNEYRNKDHLIYLANIFMNPNDALFYRKHGVEVDDDAYALSIMVQWIWRSAIRDGKPIYLYIPSRRMRTILQDWIEATSKGGVACD